MLNVKAMLNTAKYFCIGHKTELLTAGKIVCDVATVGFTIYGTVKAQPIVARSKEQLKNVKDCLEEGVTVNPETDELIEYTKKDAQEDKLKIGFQTAGKVLLCYLPAIGTFSVGEALLLKNVKGLVGSLALMTTKFEDKCDEFDNYRDRVVEDAGAAKDYEYLTGEKVTKKKIAAEEGSTEKVDVLTVDHMLPFDDGTAFDRFHGYGCRGWILNGSMQANLATLYSMQGEVNDILELEKVMTFKDLCKHMGWTYSSEELEELAKHYNTTVSHFLNNWGWNILPGMSRPGGDFIDFGIFDRDDSDCLILKDGTVTHWNSETKEIDGFRITFKACPPRALDMASVYKTIDDRKHRGLYSDIKTTGQTMTWYNEAKDYNGDNHEPLFPGK